MGPVDRVVKTHRHHDGELAQTGEGPGRPTVAIVQNAEEGVAIREALGLLPADRLSLRGRTVVLVPNWVRAKPPETATVVGPGALKTLIGELWAREPSRLVVAAGSGDGPTPEVMTKIGFDKVIAETGVEFVDLNHGPYTEVDLAPHLPGSGRAGDGDGGRLECPTTLLVNRLYEEMDALVSFTVIKHHEEAVCSLSLKNVALSWAPAEIHGFPKVRRGIHEDLHAFIAAMAHVFPVTLAVLSGCPAMVGTGPTEGKAVQTGLIVAGTDPVATDVVGARLLGFRPQAVGYLHILIQQGFGQGDLRAVDLRGLPLDMAEKAFSQAAYGAAFALDQGKILPVHLSQGG